MWGTKGDTQGHWGQTHLTGIAFSVRCLRDHHRLQWGEPERPAGRQLGVREGRGLGSPGDWVMWDWGAARTEEMKISKNWRWFVGCPWKLKGLRGDTEVPLGIEGIWGWGGAPRMSPRTGVALAPHHLPPQLSAITATMRSTEPSTARWISTGRAIPPAALWGHSVGGCWQALRLPARPIPQSPSPTCGPNLAPAPHTYP